ncbi:MAG TPA: AAA family ATPase [Polyangiales bacterium]|nr:AAA family ATPase [Polyangiales bacterium]
MPSEDDVSAVQAALGQRYTIHGLLGRGGMAEVFRATDRTLGGDVALKRLLPSFATAQRKGVAALFEHEYHTLTQLRHPRMIAVHDYGVDTTGCPYYTMELLDGGDLRARAPLPWREACALSFDVCSSLALLHSRRLIHRDVSPSNVRCTRDGNAKLIDFGAMIPMSSGGAQIVGTPAFAAPETLHRSALDARTDLFSLGATLYYTLCGTLAFPARSFADAFTAWTSKPVAPSVRVPGIPHELDDLVLSLLSIEPSMRPASAFHVMQRLAAIAGLPGIESEAVTRAYLSTPLLIGREATLREVREHLEYSGTGKRALMMCGPPGIGRSRILDAATFEAKTLGATVLRANATGSQEPFAVARALAEHLLQAVPTAQASCESFPELLEADPELQRARLKPASELRDPDGLQQALSRLIVTVSRSHPLVVAVDDVHRIDEPSAAVLAAVADKAQRGDVFVLLTSLAPERDAGFAMEVLASRCERLDLTPLSREQTQLLFGSLFGDADHLDMLAGEVFSIAQGSPGQSMQLAQHLVDRAVLKYSAGNWILPAKLAASDLPRSAEAAIRARVSQLSEPARFLAEAHALACDETLSRDAYAALRPDLDSRELGAAIGELLAAQALVENGPIYAIANRVWSAVFSSGLDADQLRKRHAALAELYRPARNAALVHHLTAAGRYEEALTAIQERHRVYVAEGIGVRDLDPNLMKMVAATQVAIGTAQRLGRPARELHELRRWICAGSAAFDARFFASVAPAWLERLRQDSGLADWQAAGDIADPGARLTAALTRAFERHQATPERERVYAVDEAIRLLAEYVVYAIALGGRSLNAELLRSLPPLLEPFAPLSPLLHAIWQNSIATRDSLCDCKYESSRLRWIDVLAKLDAVQGGEMQHVEAIRNACAYAVGMMEAQLGLSSATHWSDQLERDVHQKLGAIQLRKIVRLEQGDWQGADRMRRQGEVIALQARTPPMFYLLLLVELPAYAEARDLAGVRYVIEQIRPLAAAFPGWTSHLANAEATFELVRGDYAAAKAGFEQSLSASGPNELGDYRCLPAWVPAASGLCESLFHLERIEEARDFALHALDVCERLELGSHGYPLLRTLALCDAKRGEYPAASARLEALIERQLEHGSSGLRLGLSYEARARIAIWAEDAASYEHFARLAAREYRYGARCPLGARYERLSHEATRRGFQARVELADFEPTTIQQSAAVEHQNWSEVVLRSMAGSSEPRERAHRGLRVVCDARGARGGHLYLVTPRGVELAASQALPPPPSQLSDLVREFLVREKERSETLTVMVTGAVAEDDAIDTTVHLGTDSYELALLSSVSGGEGKVAGVIALALEERRLRGAKHEQLLSQIAAQLLAGSI